MTPTVDEAREALLALARERPYFADGSPLSASSQGIHRDTVARYNQKAERAIDALIAAVRAEVVTEYNDGPSGPALIPNGEPCPICGPAGHGAHEDDSYGACVICYEYQPHTDMEYNKVAWPCAVVRARESAETLAALREAATAYIDWRDRRRAQWAAVVKHDHKHGMTPCPEWDVLTSEPFDIDQRLDDGIRAALAATPAEE